MISLNQVDWDSALLEISYIQNGALYLENSSGSLYRVSYKEANSELICTGSSVNDRRSFYFQPDLTLTQVLSELLQITGEEFTFKFRLWQENMIRDFLSTRLREHNLVSQEHPVLYLYSSLGQRSLWYNSFDKIYELEDIVTTTDREELITALVQIAQSEILLAPQPPRQYIIANKLSPAY